MFPVSDYRQITRKERQNINNGVNKLNVYRKRKKQKKCFKFTNKHNSSKQIEIRISKIDASWDMITVDRLKSIRSIEGIVDDARNGELKSRKH